MVPPGLAWINSFALSTGLALDQRIATSVQSTVNPLVYTISMRWGEPISTKSALLVWNLFQKWAARNKTTPQGDVGVEEVRTPANQSLVQGLLVKVHLRERLGLPRDEWPE